MLEDRHWAQVSWSKEQDEELDHKVLEKPHRGYRGQRELEQEH